MYALQGQGKKRPTYQVLKVDQKILDSRWIAGYFKRCHDIAKANRKHRWIRTAVVPFPHSENSPRW